jgi:hypothetical protein
LGATGGTIEAPNSPDCRAAAYVVSVGGAVAVDDQPNEIKTTAEVPSVPFRLTRIALGGKKR